MSTKRRRIVDDDDSDLDESDKVATLTTSDITMSNAASNNINTHNGNNDDSEKAKNTVMRMLRNTKKSNSKVHLNKSKSAEPEDKKEGTIPRKPSSQFPTSTDTIPKRERDEIPKKSKATDDKDPDSNLLYLSMLPKPSSNASQSHSQSQKLQSMVPIKSSSAASSSASAMAPGAVVNADAARSRLNATPPPPASSQPPPTATTLGAQDSMTTTRRPRPSSTTRPPDSRLNQLSPVRMDIIDAVPPSAQASSLLLQHQSHQSANNGAPPPPTPARLKDEEKRVLNTLKNLCSKVNIQLLPTEDMLSGTFVLDPAASVATATDPGLEDGDEQRRIPIFPEDFAQGQPLWPLSWWGIVDPILDNKQDGTANTDQTGTQQHRINSTTGAIRKEMEEARTKLANATTGSSARAKADAIPSGTSGGRLEDDNDRYRDHDRRSRSDRSDHDRRRHHDESDQRRRKRRHHHHHHHDSDNAEGNGAGGRRLDGDDRRSDGPPPPPQHDRDRATDRRILGHPLNLPPGVSGSPPGDTGSPRRGPPPRY